MIRFFKAPHVYWCTLNRIDKRNNFGDILGKYIVEKISRKSITRVLHPSMRRYKWFMKHYLTVGSILEVANKNSVVWGSGIIRRYDFIKKAKFLAVRGPITRKRLLELGYKVPELYGDPAILLPLFFNSNPQKKYKLGIIPHYVDYEEVWKKFKDHNELKIIDLLTCNVEDVLHEILECECIISSSLHGVIVPHAYGIPALWVIFSDKLGGDNIKFYDYFESVNIHYEKEFNVKISNVNSEYLMNLFFENKDCTIPEKALIQQRKNDLLKSNPF